MLLVRRHACGKESHTLVVWHSALDRSLPEEGHKGQRTAIEMTTDMLGDAAHNGLEQRGSSQV